MERILVGLAEGAVDVAEEGEVEEEE